MAKTSKIRDQAQSEGVPEEQLVITAIEEEGSVLGASRRLNVTPNALRMFLSRRRLGVIAKVIRLTPEVYQESPRLGERIAN